MNTVYRYFRLWALMLLSAQVVVGMDADMAGQDLFNAVRFYNIDNIHAAIQAGANVNWPDGWGDTALMYALTYNKPMYQRPIEVVYTLIAAGADVNWRNQDGNTVLMRALMNNNRIEIINALIAAGADVNAQDQNGNTALMFAIGPNRSLEIINALIAAGADVNVQKPNGDTALILALWFDQSIEIINALIAAGADVNVQNHRRCTPLIRAVWRDLSLEIVNALIAAGADVNVQEQYGNTALTKSRENIHTLMKLLQALCDNNKLYDQLYAISEDQDAVIAEVESIMQQVQEQALESEQKQMILQELQDVLDSYSHGLK